MKTTPNLLTFVATLAGLCGILIGCGTAKVSGQRELSATPSARPAVIYVADFDLDAADIQSEPGQLPAPPRLPAQLTDTLPILPLGATQNPKMLARELVELMSTSLVSDLHKAGYPARRLCATDPLSKNGWLVRGVFTEVNQGNQLRRALIGLGSGKTDLQVLMNITNLAQGKPRPFYELKTSATSGHAPGAGPAIVLCPVGAAARFVVAGQDLNRSVKQTAGKITEDIIRRAM